MTKKETRKTEPTVSEVRTQLNEARKMTLKMFGAGLLAAFILAFVLAWALFSPSRPPEPPPPPPARTLSAADMKDFLQAVENSDYARMSAIGTEIFAEGNIIPDSKTMFAEYETTSYPPHTVYAFYSMIGEDKTQRVLLTMDEENKVASFLAEEMAITR